MTKILLVEDEDLNRTLVKAVLSRAQITAVRDAQILDAGSIASARERLGTADIDLILLDMNLPTVDGWTAAGVIRADPATATVPIIALTAHAMSGDKDKAIAAGCTDYCPKPIDFSDLLAKIDKYGPPKA